MMERGKGGGKGNDGQRTRWREEKGDGKASTEKGTMDSGQGYDGERKGGR